MVVINRQEIAREELTRDPIFLFQVRDVYCINGHRVEYDSDLEGFIDPDRPVCDEDGNRRALTEDELLEMDCAVIAWRTITVFLTRAEAEDYGKRNSHNYLCWHVYCVPCEGKLAELLRNMFPPGEDMPVDFSIGDKVLTAAVDPLALLSRITVDHPGLGDFHVDSENKTVYLPPFLFNEVAKILDVPVTDSATEFYAGRWVWRKW
jgi:hypothetical protein